MGDAKSYCSRTLRGQNVLKLWLSHQFPTAALTVASPSSAQPYPHCIAAAATCLGLLLKVRTGRHVREAEDANFRKTLTQTIAREDSLLRLKRRLHAAEVRTSTCGTFVHQTGHVNDKKAHYLSNLLAGVIVAQSSTGNQTERFSFSSGNEVVFFRNSHVLFQQPPLDIC